MLSRLRQTTNTVYVGAISDLDPATAQRIVQVVNAVLASSLRQWTVGRVPIARVYSDVEDAIVLLLA